MKYVMGYNETTGYYYPFVFPEECVHKDAAQVLKRSLPGMFITSAGFVYKANDEWIVGGTPSESLGIGPKPIDTIILQLFLRDGLTGLDLSNMLTYLQIQATK